MKNRLKRNFRSGFSLGYCFKGYCISFAFHPQNHPKVSLFGQNLIDLESLGVFFLKINHFRPLVSPEFLTLVKLFPFFGFVLYFLNMALSIVCFLYVTFDPFCYYIYFFVLF